MRIPKKLLASVVVSVVVLVAPPLVVARFAPQAMVLPRLFSVSEGVWVPLPLALDHQTFRELQGSVDMAFDTNGIPHVVANSDHDMYFAQGVLHASLRLFEMDLTTRAGLGRISELVGPKALEFDRFFTRFGIRQITKTEAEFLLKDQETANAIHNYVDGVNAYIRRLAYKDLPLEYKILNQWPEEWSPERVAALLKIMTFRLAGRSNDLLLTRVLQHLGAERTEALFPEFLPTSLEQYFVDTSSFKTQRHDFDWTFHFQTDFKDFPAFLQPVEVNGSNSWAIAPAKSRTGFSVLANDTHLGFQLPSIWFENQILSPNTNAYGASFPGAPGVVLGWNGPLAWGTTNGTTDVLDWYQIEFKDDSSKEYKFDGQWKTAQSFPERIMVHGALPIDVEVLKTDFGFVLDRQKNLGLAARWTAQDDSNELKVILHLDHAKSVQDCIEALKDWHAPVQNFTCADDQNISIYHAGRIPRRASGQGRTVEKGEGQNSLWAGEIPFEDLPHEVNPSRGFVFSANERPAGPNYPYYLGWDYEEPFRGQRIRAQLMDKPKLEGTDFVQIQNDVMDGLAIHALPLLFKNLKTDGFTENETTVYEAMKQWDYFDRAKSFEPTVFWNWWRAVENLLYQDLKFGDHFLFPSRARTLWFFTQMEEEPQKYKVWLKDFSSLENLVTKAFHESVKNLVKTYGADPMGWTWMQANSTELKHIAQIPGLSSGPLVMDGGRYALMANSGHHGPAWKLVVEMGPNHRAWSQIPGGVTGHPLDPEYLKFVEAWSKGEMRLVQFWKDSHQAVTNSQYIWKWSP